MNSIFKELDEIDDEELLNTVKNLKEGSYSRSTNQLNFFGDDEQVKVYSLINAVRNYFGDRRHSVSSFSGSGNGDGKETHHTYGRRNSAEEKQISKKIHSQIHTETCKKLAAELVERCKNLEISQDDIARIVQCLSYSETAKEYTQRKAKLYIKALEKQTREVKRILKDLEKDYAQILGRESEVAYKLIDKPDTQIHFNIENEKD